MLKHKLDRLENNIDVEAESRLSHLVSQLNKLEDLKNSNEYKGALGEIAVIKKLTELSDDYFQFNDVYLELNEYIKFNGSSLKSAQIDHLVVGPTGVFVIETKNWSKNYTQTVFNEGSYTPYDQIQRSSYIVYRYLNDNKYGNAIQKTYHNLANSEVKVKSILAITGSTIPFEKHRFVRVARYNQIPSHIEKSKWLLTTAHINKIASKLCSKY
ncbi:Protein with nuclease-related domain [Methanococcoides burtonii DSM 6242]|uniref:Protein with nuclease-related domain n=2 Tax=Methanococcoides burtonii TaxID=29291 RepID=Q12Y05_METBU|nr:Protein with nuclease-related domain [Methanococcoides burtonii DSM 6242]